VARRGENVADSQVLGLNVVKAQESLAAVAGGRVQNFDLRGKIRQMFATDLVNNGLPIHIGTALLGHLNIQTTRGYVAESSGIASGGRELAGRLMKSPARATIADRRETVLAC
jgi:site-specific recombinase XerD